MANPSIVVEFLAKTDDLQKGVKQASAATSSFGSSLVKVGKVAAVAAGAAGIGAVVATMKVGIDEFNESAKVAAQTEAVLKSTGHAAGVTAKQVDDLATSIMQKSGIDDEAIKSGENLLLTFTNVQNVAGKGNDIFNQATQIMADMSTALGQDMSSSAVQLGKALNDPIKGITALSRVGVSFTAAQKDQIKAMVAAGDTMKAQKLILGELNKEFGGSAEAAGNTLPGQLNILRQTFNNLAGDLVAGLMPTVGKVAAGLSDFLGRFSEAQGAQAKFQVAMDAVRRAADAAWKGLVEGVRQIDWDAVAQTVRRGIEQVVKALYDALNRVVGQTDWEKVGHDISEQIVKGMKTINQMIKQVDWAQAGVTIGQETIRGLTNFFSGVNWGQVLRAGFLLMYNYIAAQNALFGAIAVSLGRAIVNGVVAGLSGLGAAVQSFVGKIPGYVASAAAAVAAAARSIGVAIVQGMISGIASMAGSLAQKAKDVVMGAVNAAKNALHIGSPSKLWASLGVDTIEGYILGITQTEPKLKGKSADAVLAALNAARQAVEGQQGAFRDTFDKLGTFAARAFEGRTQQILAKIGDRFDTAIGRWQDFADAATPAEKQLNALQKQEDARQRAADVGAAKAAVRNAITEEEQNAALEQLRQANLANTMAGLQDQAVAERAARQQQASEKIAALEADRQREIQNVTEIRQQRATSLDDQLQDLRDRLAKHPEEYDKIQKQIVKLLNSYGVNFTEAGQTLGEAFAAGLKASEKQVEKAAKSLAQVVARYLPHSPAETGPLSRTDFFRDFGGMLARNLAAGAGPLAGAASGLAGGVAGALAPGVTGLQGGTLRPDVRVFIGDTELRGLVRTEVITENNRTAQTLLAGLV